MDVLKISRAAALSLTNDDNQFRGYDNAERVITELLMRETDLLRQEVAALKHSVVDTIGGTVEGYPTSEINYLQRLRQLVGAEKIANRLLADLENVVEGLDPEEAAQVNEMRAVLDAIRS